MIENSFITRMKSKPETRSLLELYVGIIICSVLFLIVGVFFIKPRIWYCTGVLLGAFGAAYQAYGIYDTLDRALIRDKEGAKKYSMLKSMTRLLISFVLMLISILISYAMFLGVVLGLFSLKLSGVFNPIIKTKILNHEDLLSEKTEGHIIQNEPLNDTEDTEEDMSESEYHRP